MVIIIPLSKYNYLWIRVFGNLILMHQGSKSKLSGAYWGGIEVEGHSGANSSVEIDGAIIDKIMVNSNIANGIKFMDYYEVTELDYLDIDMTAGTAKASAIKFNDCTNLGTISATWSSVTFIDVPDFALFIRKNSNYQEERYLKKSSRRLGLKTYLLLPTPYAAPFAK